VQANVQQSLKWDPESRVPTLRAYVELTRANLGSDLIVWPETAVPDFLHRVREVFIEPLAAEAREAGAELVIGIPVLEVEDNAYYNGLIAVGGGEDLYTKRHLVPFGEFIPFKRWLGPLAEAFEVPMSDFSAGTADRPLLRVGEHLAGVSICYEDAFPAEVAQALPDAAYLINVSNDAWFGDSLAPHQHLEIARMRALENGRALVRATNTGVSAILDHRGRVLGTVPAFERGALTATIEPRAGATPFAALKNLPVIVLALGMLLVAVAVAGLRARRR
jgi:apolipoprotein N-acyltransferase